jgi:hypothetical protein
MSELMKDIPNDKPDKETIRKQVQEFMELKNQVTIKRRQLKALGVKDDPELSSMMIKYPDLQAQYKQQKVAKAASKPAAVKADTPTTKQVVPVDSPFIDPNAKPVKIAAPAPEPVKVQEEKPAPVAPAPASTPAPVPVPSKPIDIPVAAPVQRRVQTNVVSTPLRVAHDGRWLF